MLAIFVSVGWEMVVLLLVLALFVSGLVMFIVGLSQKRPALWGPGLGLMLLPILLALAAAALWFFMPVPSGRLPPRPRLR